MSLAATRHPHPFLFSPPFRPRSAKSALLAGLLAACLWAAPHRALAATVELAWNAVPEAGIQGYRVHVGTASHQYVETHDTGTEPKLAVNELEYGKAYWFAVSAIGATGLESELSGEVTVTLATPTTPAELLVNGSFESGTAGWSAAGNQNIQSSAPYVPTDGEKIVAFNAGNQAPDGVLSQTVATVPGETYQLTFDAGVLAYNTDPETLVVNVAGAGELLSESVTITGAGGGINRWETRTYSFVADSASTILTFSDQSAVTQSIDLLLDHVSLTGTAPTVVAPPESIGTPVLSGTPGAMVIRMDAAAPGTYVLERSEDLVNWLPAAETLLAEPGQIEFDDATAPPPISGRIFYRIGLRPAAAN